MSGLKNTKTLDCTHKFCSVPHDLNGTGRKSRLLLLAHATV